MLAAKTFNEYIRLGMKGGSVDVENVEESGKVVLKGGNELGTLCGRKARMADLGGAKGISTGSGGSGGKGCGLSLVGGVVNDNEDVCALGMREESEQVNMDVGETVGRNRNGSGCKGVFWRFDRTCTPFSRD